MTDSIILAVGIFAFSMTVLGVVLTVKEFRSNVHPRDRWHVERHEEKSRA